VEALSGAGAFDRLDRLEYGWWAGFAAYDLGRAIEPVRSRPGSADPLPDLLLARFDSRLVLDPRDGTGRVVGTGPGRPMLEWALCRARREAATTNGPALRGWRTSLTHDEFVDAVRIIREHLAAGDCYQVNLTRRLTCDEPADPVALYAALDAHNPAPHSAFLRFADGASAPLAVVSASPERFLAWRGRRVESRPIKGTGQDAHRLQKSAKDRAENLMIVDLARNDLGRVCEPGSIHVPSLCVPESHPGLVHLVSTVRGRRRPDTGPGALVRATFPPASVTGAPKPRVMQIIEDLEPVRRGVYCGAIGWIDVGLDAGDFNVAIRTFTVTGERTHLGVGAGIVADSSPMAEWDETELKAARLLAAAALDTPTPLTPLMNAAGARG
jgi:para-aminobenzoate synthetase component 1